MSQPCDEHAMAQIELYAHLEQQASAISPIPPEIEIDSIDDPDFGSMYRVWHGMRLLGTFYRRLDGFYISQPVNSNQVQEWATDTEAIEAIVTA
ncbi:hypothetical protein [Anabaena sp. PCC 7108]|uniref:hypothetical protein n=1 Tax=Anabaena sp. PCC 7108 TaxID=163908 RepID=UPI00036D4E51|nr:hypothetical protein [Anabaena sp. PCC 7108]